MPKTCATCLHFHVVDGFFNECEAPAPEVAAFTHFQLTIPWPLNEEVDCPCYLFKEETP